MEYDVQDWYFIVGGANDVVFSTKRLASVQVSDDVYASWLQAGNAPTVALDQNAVKQVLIDAGLPFDLMSYAAARRYALETGGISVNGVQVATDDRSKQMIMGARIAAAADAAFTTPWVGADGAIVQLSAAQVIAVSDAVLAHVQACFQTFATVSAGLSATPPTITTRDQIDTAFAAAA